MKKHFKFYTTLMLVIILSITCTFNVFAEGTYTDSDTGVSFTVPDGWSAIGLSKEDRQVAKERFSTGNSGELFVFLCANLYDQLPDEYKKQYSEDVFVGYRLSNTDVQDMINDSDGGYSSYSTETIGGVEWYILKNSLLDYYVQYINGNMIGFSVSNLMSSDKTKQVKEVIKEVTLAEVAKENVVEAPVTNNQTTAQNTTNSSSSLSLEEDNARMIKDLFIWIGIAIVFFFIKSKWKKKEVKKEIIICNKCGTENEKTNKFCVKCGEELNK